MAAGLGTCGYLWIASAKDPGSDVRHASRVVLGVFIMLGAATILLTGLVYSAALGYYARFLYTFAGRGALVIALAALSVQDGTALSLGIGVTAGLVGALLVLLQVASSLGAPEPLFYWGPRDALGRPVLEPPGAVVAAAVPVVPVPGYGGGSGGAAAATTKHHWWGPRGRRASSQTISPEEGAPADAWLPSGTLGPGGGGAGGGDAYYTGGGGVVTASEARGYTPVPLPPPGATPNPWGPVR